MAREIRKVVAAAALVTVLAALAVWLVPAWLVGHPHLSTAARLSAMAGVRTAMIAFLGVLGGLGGLYYTGRTFRLSRDAQAATNANTSKTLHLTEQGQITDRFTKAIDQLGSDSAEVVLGGIYALGRIMRDSPGDEAAIVAVLSALIRRRGKRKPDGTVPWSPDEAERDEVKPSFTIQAALNVIAQRTPADPLARPDLRDSDLRGARLGGAELTGASLRRSCLWKAHMDGAVLAGASLADADLTEARLADADLAGASLHRSCLVKAHLAGADLAGADLAGADLKRAVVTEGSLTREQLAAITNRGAIMWVARSERRQEAPQAATGTPAR
jgi:hypothetical protein